MRCCGGIHAHISCAELGDWNYIFAIRIRMNIFFINSIYWEMQCNSEFLLSD